MPSSIFAGYGFPADRQEQNLARRQFLALMRSTSPLSATLRGASNLHPHLQPYLREKGAHLISSPLLLSAHILSLLSLLTLQPVSI